MVELFLLFIIVMGIYFICLIIHEIYNWNNERTYRKRKREIEKYYRK